MKLFLMPHISSNEGNTLPLWMQKGSIFVKWQVVDPKLRQNLSKRGWLSWRGGRPKWQNEGKAAICLGPSTDPSPTIKSNFHLVSMPVGTVANEVIVVSPSQSTCVAWVEGRLGWVCEGLLCTALGYHVAHSKENLDHNIESHLCEFCSQCS